MSDNVNIFAQTGRDAIILANLSRVTAPNVYDKALLGTLMMRYTEDLFSGEITEILSLWKMTPRELFRQCREIWLNGFRPEDLNVSGSSWDSKSGD